MVNELLFSKHICMAAPYGRDVMSSTKRITVTEAVWADLSGMKEPGMTFSELIETMIEREKKRRLVGDIRRIREGEELVEIPLQVFATDGLKD